MANLGNFDLNLLKSLRVLLEERNVTRAGERLHLSQSAVSAVLGRLRRDLNDPILVRGGRSLLLTPFAESIHEPLIELLTMADRLLASGQRFDPATENRTFRLMASDYVATLKFPELMAKVHQHAPQIKMDLQALSDGYIEKLRRNEIDVLFISDVIRAREVPEFPHKRFFQDRFVACLSSTNRSVHGRLDPETLIHMPYIEYAPHGMRSIADVHMDEQGISRDVSVRTDNQLLVPSLIQGTSMVAIIPERLAHIAAAGADIRIVELSFDVPVIDQIAIWHPQRAEDPAIRWLVGTLIQENVAPGSADGGF